MIGISLCVMSAVPILIAGFVDAPDAAGSFTVILLLISYGHCANASGAPPGSSGS